MRVGAQGVQLPDVVDVDESGGGGDAAPDINDEIGAAAKEPAVGILQTRLLDLIQRGRADQLEVRQRIHQASSLISLVVRFRSSPALAVTFRCELRNLRTTSNSMIVVPLLNPKFAIKLASRSARTSVSGHYRAHCRRGRAFP